MELKSILLNREQGSAQLLARAVDWLVQHPGALEGEPRGDTLDILRMTRPSMAGFARLADRLSQELPRGGVVDVLKRIRVEIEAVDRQLAARFALFAATLAPCRVVTLSWSSTVLAALFASRASVSEIHMLESWPGGEGFRAMEEAERFHDHVHLHSDEELALAAQQADVAIIGADTVFTDHAVLNKVLSKALAEACFDQNKPFYALASTWKFSPYSSEDYARSAGESRLFGIVPAAWITGLFTEARLVRGAGDRLP